MVGRDAGLDEGDDAGWGKGQDHRRRRALWIVIVGMQATTKFFPRTHIWYLDAVV